MKFLGLLFVAVPGSLVLGLVFLAWREVAKVRAADEAARAEAAEAGERPPPQFDPPLALLFWSRFWTLALGVPYALHLAVLRNEGASTPREARANELAATDPTVVADGAMVYPLGDLTIAKGPAVGAGQVLRVNVERLWAQADWKARALAVDPRGVSALVLKGNERRAMWASVAVLAEELQTAKGDERTAARRYNGSGPAAEAYADRAMSFRAYLA